MPGLFWCSMPRTRVALIIVVLVVVVLTITLPAWVFGDAIQAERNADSPGSDHHSSAAQAALQASVQLLCPLDVLAAFDVAVPAPGFGTGTGVPNLTWLVRSGLAAVPPPGC